MKTTNEVLEGLSTLVLDDIISSYTKAFTPPPPPYVSTTVSDYEIIDYDIFFVFRVSRLQSCFTITIEICPRKPIIDYIYMNSC